MTLRSQESNLLTLNQMGAGSRMPPALGTRSGPALVVILFLRHPVVRVAALAAARPESLRPSGWGPVAVRFGSLRGSCVERDGFRDDARAKAPSQNTTGRQAHRGPATPVVGSV